MTRTEYIRYLVKLIRPSFIWEKLPEGISSIQIEQQIQIHGQVAIIPFGEGWAAEKFVRDGFDIYDNPTKIRIVSINTKLDGKVFEDGENYYVYHDSTKTSALNGINSLIEDLVKLDKRIMENIDMNRLQLFIENEFSKAGKSNNKDAQELARRIKGGDIVIAVESGFFDKDRIKGLQEFVKDNSMNIWENWFNKWNQLTNILGVNTNETNYKKANVIKEEVATSEEVVNRVVRDQLNQRTDFLDRIKTKHTEWEGVEIKVLQDVIKQEQMDKFQAFDVKQQNEIYDPKDMKDKGEL